MNKFLFKKERDKWLCIAIAERADKVIAVRDTRIAALESSITVRDTEIARLETDLELARRDVGSLIEAAYREGWADRDYYGMYERTKLERDWAESESRKSLEARAGNGGEG